MVTEVPDK